MPSGFLFSCASVKGGHQPGFGHLKLLLATKNLLEVWLKMSKDKVDLNHQPCETIFPTSLLILFSNSFAVQSC